MGTRSLTYFVQDGKPFCCFYRQMDGYPEGHGADLGKILAPITLVNGYQFGMKTGEFANGPGCLAAQVIAALKNEQGIGGIYLVSPNQDDHKEGWQEYEYFVHVNMMGDDFNATYVAHVEVTDTERTLFTGSFEEFYEWAQNPPKDEEGNFTPVVAVKSNKNVVYGSLRAALHNEVVSVRFTKADGSKRLMKCTTDLNRIPEDKAPIGDNIPLRIDPKLYKVFDTEKQDWREFREERIINWKVS